MMMVVLILLLALLPSLRLVDSQNMRLVRGAGPCDGDLQIKHLNQWEDVAFSEFTMKTADALCQYLNCASVVSHERRTSNTHAAVQINLDCVKYTKTHCVQKVNVSTQYYYGINCSESTQLVSGPRKCSGSLAVFLNETWNLVCREDFGLKDAEVACRQLGCGAPNVLQGASYHSKNMRMRQTFQCEGHESVLTDCPRSSSADSKCPSRKAVVLSCSELMRLEGDSDGCAGTLQMRQRGQWRPVMVDLEGLPRVAEAVCPLLDCGSVVSFHFTSFFHYEPVWILSNTCTRKTSDLRQCVYAAGSLYKTAVYMECSGNAILKERGQTYEAILLLQLQWLVPVNMVFIIGVIVLIVYKRKKASMNETTNSRPTNPENVICSNTSVYEDNTYQSLEMGTMEPEYNQL